MLGKEVRVRIKCWDLPAAPLMRLEERIRPRKGRKIQNGYPSSAPTILYESR
jgi:hypothetical protein